MTTAILTQRTDHTVADARDQIRHATRADTGCVIVVDDGLKLAGLVTPIALLRSTGKTLLTEVMDHDIEPLSSRARVASVRDMMAWDRFTCLPVVSRRKHVIGALNRATVRSALATPAVETSRSDQGIPAVLMDAFSGYLVGLARMIDSGPGAAGKRNEGGPGR